MFFKSFKMLSLKESCCEFSKAILSRHLAVVKVHSRLLCDPHITGIVMYHFHKHKNTSHLQKKLKNLTLSLWKALECSICLEPVSMPFKQCLRGHMYCSKCLTTIAVCPTCKGHFVIENPVGVKNILEVLPKKCRFAREGCEDIVEPGNDHETFCGYRIVMCREKGCNTQMTVYDLLKHYETKHETRFIVKVQEEKTVLGQNFSPYAFRNDDLPVVVSDYTFLWISVTNDICRKQLLFQFECLPIGKPKHNYYATIRFEKGNHLHAYGHTIKAFMIGASKDIIKSKPGVDSNDSSVKRAFNNIGYIQTQYCMSVPQDKLKRFVDKNKDLSFKIRVFTEEID